jgi:hypothetical protein
MKKEIQLTCCISDKAVPSDEEDSYVLQVRKAGTTSPEMWWSHGWCPRKAIPVVGEEIPK